MKLATVNTNSTAIKTTPEGMPLDITERLRSASPQDVKTELKALAVAFNHQLTPERAVVYFEAINGEPLWVIKRAAKEFRTGTAPNHSNKAFMPSPAELGERVRDIIKTHRENAAPRDLPAPTSEFVKSGTPESRAIKAAEILKRHGFRELVNNSRGDANA